MHLMIRKTRRQAAALDLLSRVLQEVDMLVVLVLEVMAVVLLQVNMVVDIQEVLHLQVKAILLKVDHQAVHQEAMVEVHLPQDKVIHLNKAAIHRSKVDIIHSNTAVNREDLTKHHLHPDIDLPELREDMPNVFKLGYNVSAMLILLGHVVVGTMINVNRASEITSVAQRVT